MVLFMLENGQDKNIGFYNHNLFIDGDIDEGSYAKVLYYSDKGVDKETEYVLEFTIEKKNLCY
jgi:hypothetical protein